MEHLFCYHNKLTNLKGLDKLPELKTAPFFGNPLTYKSNNLPDILKEIKIELKKQLLKKCYLYIIM